MSKLRQIPFGDVVHFKKGINYTSNDYGNEDNGVPFITIKCFKKGGGYEKNGLKYFNGVFNESDTLVKGQVLFSVTDLTRAGDIVGSPLKVPDFGKSRISLASMDLMKIEPKDGECINEYIYYCLMSDDIRRKMVTFSAGSTVLHLDIKRVPEFIVPIPKISFQRKIACILSTVDAVIEKTEAAIVKYKMIKAGMMRDLFTRGIDLKTGRLRPSYEESPELYKQSELGWVPKKWNEGRFIDLADKNISHSFTGGPFGSDLQTKHYTITGVRIIQLQNIGDGVFNNKYKIYTDETKANQLINCNIYPGEIIMSKMADPIARACIIPNTAKRFLMASDGIRLAIDKRKFNTCFILETINNNRFRRIAELKAIGSTRSRIGLTELKDIPIIYPEKKEQDLIGQRLDTINDLLKDEENYLNKIKQLKQALMSDLLTGKVRVKYEEEKEEVGNGQNRKF